MIQGQILQFKILNIYKKPAYTNRETGEVTPELDILQVSQNIELRNGQNKNIYFDIKAPNSAQHFKNSIDKQEFLNVSATHVNNNTYYTLINDKPISKELAQMMINELSTNVDKKIA